MAIKAHFGWFLTACLLAGCSQPYMTVDRLERGLVIVLPGIEGRSLLNEEICRGLAKGGVDWAIRLEDWTSPWGPLYNLRDEVGNRRKAEDIARRIAEYRFNHPGRPVALVGQSGGAAIAAWSAEALAPGHRVDGIVMLAPSLSPEYMLDWALARSRGGIVSFYSQGDWMLLSTQIAGTMDGQYTISAGRAGFEIPKASDPAAYEKLHQIAWDESIAWSGHTGGHLSSGAETFVAEFVAPLVLEFAMDLRR